MGKTDSTIVIVEDFNTHFQLWTDYPNNKINKEIAELNCTLYQMDLTDVCRTFHPTAAEYAFFLTAHGTFCRMDHKGRPQNKSQQIFLKY